jgi:hypothetical protein
VSVSNSSDEEQNISSDECPWASIVSAIKVHAATQTPDVAADLAAWAELLEGLAQLDITSG